MSWTLSSSRTLEVPANLGFHCVSTVRGPETRCPPQHPGAHFGAEIMMSSAAVSRKESEHHMMLASVREGLQFSMNKESCTQFTEFHCGVCLL